MSRSERGKHSNGGSNNLRPWAAPTEASLKTGERLQWRRPRAEEGTLNPSLPSACPEPGNPGEQFRPDGHDLRSACACLLGPSGRPPSPARTEDYKLRQKPGEAPGRAWTAQGFFFVGVRPLLAAPHDLPGCVSAVSGLMHFTPFF